MLIDKSFKLKLFIGVKFLKVFYTGAKIKTIYTVQPEGVIIKASK